MPPTSDTLGRFHRVLLQEIAESWPEYLTQPFTIAEIYQNLVPYRSHRDLIGVEMNGDYEDILLRLLAGEGDYLLLDSEVARREIRQELENASPNTGLFRDFAAADVRLNPDRVLEAARDAGAAVSADVEEEESTRLPLEREGDAETVDIAELRPDDEDGAAAAADSAEFAETGDAGVVGHIALADTGLLVVMPGSEADDLRTRDHEAPRQPEEPTHPEEPEQPGGSEESGDAEAPGASAEGGPSACHWCRQSLPHRELLNFCPFCGSDIRLFPCPKCGEELEPRWQFCVSCGTGVSE